MSLRKIVLTRFSHDPRQLLRSDNMIVVLAFSRFRSSRYTLRVQIRKFAAYSLAGNVFVSVGRIPSELNFSDRPSRFFSSESKLPVEYVDDSWFAANHSPAKPDKASESKSDADAGNCQSPFFEPGGQLRRHQASAAEEVDSGISTSSRKLCSQAGS